MLKVVSRDKSFEVSFDGDESTTGTLNGEPFQWDVAHLRDRVFHIVDGSRSYNVEVIAQDRDAKSLTLRVNGRKFEVAVQDSMDLLLEKMGMSDLAVQQVKDVKAPMPGLVLDVLVEPGAAISKGDPILVLEAMKMENVIKSPADGTLKEISVQKGQAVEKGAALVHFD